MATYGRHHNIQIGDEIALIRDQVRRDIFDGAEYPTEIILKSTSATMDEFTEEITYTGSDTLVPVSGIIGRVVENDALMGVAGRVKMGDVSLLYHYDAISGTLHNNKIEQIRVLATAASGLYNVAGMHVESLANEPIYIKFALQLDDSGTS